MRGLSKKEDLQVPRKTQSDCVEAGVRNLCVVTMVTETKCWKRVREQTHTHMYMWVKQQLHPQLNNKCGDTQLNCRHCNHTLTQLSLQVRDAVCVLVSKQ